MTNVKIQMTNQIQMFKCLNDSVKNPDQRSGILCRPLGRPVSLQKAAFRRKVVFRLESQSRFNLRTPRSRIFDHSVSCLARGIIIVPSRRYSGLLTSNRLNFWILVFGIHLTFELWHLTLITNIFSMGKLPPCRWQMRAMYIN